MGVAEIRRLRQLEDENGKLTRLVADPTLDKTMLRGELWRVTGSVVMANLRRTW
jgi:putative transposase